MPAMNEFDSAVLTEDLKQHGLRAGDVGTVVLVHRGGEGYEVEFCTLAGETIAVVTVTSAQVRPAANIDVVHVRRRAG